MFIGYILYISIFTIIIMFILRAPNFQDRAVINVHRVSPDNGGLGVGDAVSTRLVTTAT